MKNGISEKIADLLTEITQNEIKLSKIKNSKDLLNDLGLDSIAVLRVIMEIEKVFDIKIDTSELNIQLFSDFSRLTGFVKARVNG